jgi:hypothetical protein
VTLNPFLVQSQEARLSIKSKHSDKMMGTSSSGSEIDEIKKSMSNLSITSEEDRQNQEGVLPKNKSLDDFAEDTVLPQKLSDISMINNE